MGDSGKWPRVFWRAARWISPAPDTAIAAGMVLVSEDRKRYGLVLDQSIGFNLSLSSLGAVRRGGLLDASREAVRNWKCSGICV